MTTKPRIAIVGPGRLGGALAQHLRRAGYTITDLVSPKRTRSNRRTRSLAATLGARVSNLDNAVLNANLVWFCVPDRQIAVAASLLAKKTNWSRKTAFHSSGALPSGELAVLRQRGAAIASVHPMMTFVRGTVPSLQGVPFALEGDLAALRIAQKIVRNLGGLPFKIAAKHKVAYHAWGAFASPLLIALLVSAEQVARAAGLSAADARKKMLPILKQTIGNYARLGPARASSGPFVRGDAETVRKHLKILRAIPEAREVYLALAQVTLRSLPMQNKSSLRQILSLMSALGAVEVGDRVRIIEVPPLKPTEHRTHTIFQRCLGKVFPVAGFQKGLIELQVGRVVGRFPGAETIWVEPEFLERVDSPRR
ncbi:MAG TPA: Rossmann-like and DUF2520 domain-containing protein [Terriglobales bacterium]|nr:Rossmann-like and DUF2520 domain-containing protein [Terriglobales bacterium]